MLASLSKITAELTDLLRPHEKPPGMVQAEASLSEARKARSDAAQVYKDRCTQAHEENNTSETPEMISSQSKLKAAEAEVNLAIVELEKWRKRYTAQHPIKMDRIAEIIRPALVPVEEIVSALRVRAEYDLSNGLPASTLSFNQTARASHALQDLKHILKSIASSDEVKKTNGVAVR